MSRKKPKSALQVIFFIYIFIMLYLLFFRKSRYAGGTYMENLSMNVNLIPFYSIRQYFDLIFKQSNPYLLPYAVVNLVGNIAVFVPFGFLLPVMVKQAEKPAVFLLISAGCIVMVELTQLFTLRGSCDIDDLILNLTGSIAGYAVYHIVKFVCGENGTKMLRR